MLAILKAAEAALTFCELVDCVAQVLLAEIRPKLLRNMNLGVTELPELEV